VALPRTVQLTSSEISSFDKPGADIFGWLMKHGGADTEDTFIKLVLKGNRDHAVKVIDLEAVKGNCDAPLQGSLFEAYTAGGEPNINVVFDLDSSKSTAKEISKEDPTKLENYFDNHSVSLAPDEQQTFSVNARSSKAYCEFSINVTVLDGNAVKVLHVDNSGKPFRVTSQRPFSEYGSLYVGGIATYKCSHRWVRQNPKSFNESNPHC
jgi:hypothetical protein